ncbi:MAG: alcohol dehydrogenase catalytic domain-containing protein, partial [Nitrososphaeraceae archaeon]
MKVQSADVCHSDIHLWEGGYEGPGGQFLKTTDRGVKHPLTPGHEVAGYVESLGEAVTMLKNGKILGRG